MNTQPEISIITPVFNTEKYLAQCIDSIIAQTFQNWELILVDDGSTDHSGAICDEYASRDHRIRVIHKANSGVSDSRNIAIAQSRGTLLGFVDADDWIDPGMYSTLHRDLTANNADIAVCGYTFDWTNMNRPRHKDTTFFKILDRQEAIALTYEDKLIQSIFCDKLWRRELATAKMPEGRFYEDYATVIKWMSNARRVTLNFTPLYHYRMRSGSTVNGVDPERRYHFLLAEIERAHFLQSIGITVSNGFSPRILHTAVTAAKLVARGCSDRNMAMSYITRITDAIRPFLPADEGDLDRKTYSRLQKMLHHPSRFINAVRFSNLFLWSAKHKNKHLYP